MQKNQSDGRIVADLVHQSLEITGKRELVRRSSWETSAHRRPGLLIDLATGIATWTSSTTMSTIVIALQDQPSENPIIRKWQKVSFLVVNSGLKLIIRRWLLSL